MLKNKKLTSVRLSQLYTVDRQRGRQEHIDFTSKQGKELIVSMLKHGYDRNKIGTSEACHIAVLDRDDDEQHTPPTLKLPPVKISQTYDLEPIAHAIADGMDSPEEAQAYLASAPIGGSITIAATTPEEITFPTNARYEIVAGQSRFLALTLAREIRRIVQGQTCPDKLKHGTTEQWAKAVELFAPSLASATIPVYVLDDEAEAQRYADLENSQSRKLASVRISTYEIYKAAQREQDRQRAACGVRDPQTIAAIIQSRDDCTRNDARVPRAIEALEILRAEGEYFTAPHRYIDPEEGFITPGNLNSTRNDTAISTITNALKAFRAGKPGPTLETDCLEALGVLRGDVAKRKAPSLKEWSEIGDSKAAEPIIAAACRYAVTAPGVFASLMDAMQKLYQSSTPEVKADFEDAIHALDPTA